MHLPGHHFLEHHPMFSLSGIVVGVAGVPLIILGTLFVLAKILGS